MATIQAAATIIVDIKFWIRLKLNSIHGQFEWNWSQYVRSKIRQENILFAQAKATNTRTNFKSTNRDNVARNGRDSNTAPPNKFWRDPICYTKQRRIGVALFIWNIELSAKK